MVEVDHTIVSIRFSGKDLDPKEMGELLGFIELETIKTTVKRVKNGRVVWSIGLENDKAIPLEKKIEALLAQFTNEINLWELATENVKADIFCG